MRRGGGGGEGSGVVIGSASSCFMPQVISMRHSGVVARLTYL